MSSWKFSLPSKVDILTCHYARSGVALPAIRLQAQDGCTKPLRGSTKDTKSTKKKKAKLTAQETAS
jgi:hypothetical protein